MTTYDSLDHLSEFLNDCNKLLYSFDTACHTSHYSVFTEYVHNFINKYNINISSVYRHMAMMRQINNPLSQHSTNNLERILHTLDK